VRIKVPAAPGRAVANTPSIALNGMGWDLGIAVRCGTPGAAAAPRPAALQPCSPTALQPRSTCQPATKGSLSGGSWQRRWEEKFAAGGKSKFISRSCAGTGANFQNKTAISL